MDFEKIKIVQELDNKFVDAINRGNTIESITLIDELIRLEPTHDVYQFSKGKILMEIGQYEEAYRFLLAAIDYSTSPGYAHCKPFEYSGSISREKWYKLYEFAVKLIGEKNHIDAKSYLYQSLVELNRESYVEHGIYLDPCVIFWLAQVEAMEGRFEIACSYLVRSWMDYQDNHTSQLEKDIIAGITTNKS